MIGKKAEAVLNRAVRYAIDRDHEYFTLEHVLWSLLQEKSIAEIIEACGGLPEALQKDLVEHLDKSPKTEKLAEGAVQENTESDHPVATLSVQRVIQRALFQVQSSGKDEIRPEDLFVAIFQAKESHALFLLTQQGVERLDAIDYISHGARKPEGASENAGDADEEEGSSEHEPKKSKSRKGAAVDPLALYAINLNDRARDGKIDPLVGRATELERVIQTLCRRRKNNPLLVGEAGVGKTAIAEGLALRITRDEIPDPLKDAVVYSLDMGSIIAGTKFRGDFEQRMKSVLGALERKRLTGKLPVLLIDEIHTIIGAGAVSGGALDAANLLKPLLSRGELRCIGTTTYAEYRNIFEKDHALARRFQKIDVVEPSIDEAIQILEGLKPVFEEHHGIKFTADAIRASVELASKHLTDRFLPDKAIDVLDEAGAKARLKRPPNTQSAPLGADAVEEVIAQIARIPARSVSVNQKTRLKSIDRDLKLAIFGQDPAIEALSTSIRLARSGLRSGDRPVGSFLFCGPTGVGKTELTKQLAHTLGVPFLRFDMSEYSEKHTISRLIGAPPGYVGFDQAGLLTDAALKNPHSVILLDEIEKAHADIWNILLQVMDHGMLTDNNGRKADFRNVILIMTSNVGSRDLEKRSLGMVQSENKGTAAQKAVEQTFSPEFRNRLDAIVYFNPLDPVTIGHIVGKQLLELESQLLAKGVEAEFSPELREWLAQKGYDRLMGARPMARLIQDRIKKPLSEEILFGKLEHGGSVKIDLDSKPNPEGGAPKFEITAKEKASADELEPTSSASKTPRE
jgi:ATP-dependent Clp protease ATP-binding subunit ClpA